MNISLCGRDWEPHREKKDIESVVDVIVKLGALIYTVKSVSDIEINPLVALEGKGVKAVDVRILLSKEVT